MVLSEKDCLGRETPACEGRTPACGALSEAKAWGRDWGCGDFRLVLEARLKTQAHGAGCMLAEQNWDYQEEALRPVLQPWEHQGYRHAPPCPAISMLLTSE